VGRAETISPRIDALRRDLEVDRSGALQAFWAAISRDGAPLVEPIDGDQHHVLVTFLWRMTEDVRNVVVIGGVVGWGDFAKHQLTRLGDTDLWFKTYRARSDTRTVYRLSPNDVLLSREEVADDTAWEERVKTFQPDPLNPHRYTFFSEDAVWSRLELPDAPPQPFVASRPDAPKGEVVQHRLPSEILGNERDVWVYTPPGYLANSEPYHLLLLFDGRAYTQLVPTPTILDNLLVEKKIPPIVAVMPSNPDQETRTRELPAYPPFADFLARELIPWARANYHVTADAKRTVVAGSSFGGLAATFAGLTHPELFGNVLSQSGSYWWKPGWRETEDDGEFEWHTKQFVDGPRLALRFYLDVGLLETGRPRDVHPGQILANRHLRDVLQAKGYSVHYAEFNGGHDYLCWQGTLANGLIALIGIDRIDQ
jgi:enterochelin esterase-like enzyme